MPCTAVTERHEESQDWTPTPPQARAVDLIAAGMDDGAVAEAVGVRRETVNRWRHRHPWMEAAVNARRQDAWEATAHRLRSLATAAVDVLAARMTAAQANVSRGGTPNADDVRAAAAVLRMLGAGEWLRDCHDAMPVGSTDGGSIASRRVEAEVRAELESLSDDDPDEEQVFRLCPERYAELCREIQAQDTATATGEG